MAEFVEIRGLPYLAAEHTDGRDGSDTAIVQPDKLAIVHSLLVRVEHIVVGTGVRWVELLTVEVVLDFDDMPRAILEMVLCGSSLAYGYSWTNSLNSSGTLYACFR